MSSEVRERFLRWWSEKENKQGVAVFVSGFLFAMCSLAVVNSCSAEVQVFNSLREMDITGLLIFIGITCGLSHKGRLSLVWSGCAFACGFVFAISHFFLRLFPDLEVGHYSESLIFQRAIFGCMIQSLVTTFLFCLMAHDKNAKSLTPDQSVS